MHLSPRCPLNRYLYKYEMQLKAWARAQVCCQPTDKDLADSPQRKVNKPAGSSPLYIGVPPEFEDQPRIVWNY